MILGKEWKFCTVHCFSSYLSSTWYSSYILWVSLFSPPAKWYAAYCVEEWYTAQRS